MNKIEFWQKKSCRAGAVCNPQVVCEDFIVFVLTMLTINSIKSANYAGFTIIVLLRQQ